MKKLQTSLLAVAALAGVGAAFAFKAPNKKFFFNVIYAKRVNPSGTQQFSYSTATYLNPTVIDCLADVSGTACTFTTTKTVQFFNNNKAGSFPTDVHLLTPGSIYKLD